LYLKVKVPPYCGVPRLSHQFPAAVVVVVEGVVVTLVAFVSVVVAVVVLVVVDVVFVVDGELDVDVVDVAQDASSIAAIIKKLKPNQINLFFI